MSYKTWVNDEVVTADNLNNHLRDQVVSVFADAATRDTDITSPKEGMLCYLASENAYYTYNGTSWVRMTSQLSGVSVNRTTDQSTPESTTDTLEWTTEQFDTDGFITVTSDTITVPSGLDGLYAINFESTNPGTGSSSTRALQLNGTTILSNSGTWVGLLTASDQLIVRITAGSGFGAAILSAAELHLYRLGFV